MIKKKIDTKEVAKLGIDIALWGPRMGLRLLGKGGAIEAYLVMTGRAKVPKGLQGELRWDKSWNCMMFRGWPLQIIGVRQVLLLPILGWSINFAYEWGGRRFEGNLMHLPESDLFGPDGERLQRPGQGGQKEFVDLLSTEDNLKAFLASIVDFERWCQERSEEMQKHREELLGQALPKPKEE